MAIARNQEEEVSRDEKRGEGRRAFGEAAEMGNEVSDDLMQSEGEREVS